MLIITLISLADMVFPISLTSILAHIHYYSLVWMEAS